MNKRVSTAKHYLKIGLQTPTKARFETQGFKLKGGFGGGAGVAFEESKRDGLFFDDDPWFYGEGYVGGEGEVASKQAALALKAGGSIHPMDANWFGVGNDKTSPSFWQFDKNLGVKGVRLTNFQDVLFGVDFGFFTFEYGKKYSPDFDAQYYRTQGL